MKPKVKVLALGILLIFICFTSSQAGTSGKIAGTIKDSETNQPLPGVTLLLEGTNIGTSTDEDGDYFLINIPVGSYALKAALIGYETIKKFSVKVFTDLTTPIDFQLKPSPIPLTSSITVVA